MESGPYCDFLLLGLQGKTARRQEMAMPQYDCAGAHDRSCYFRCEVKRISADEAKPPRHCGVNISGFFMPSSGEQFMSCHNHSLAGAAGFGSPRRTVRARRRGAVLRSSCFSFAMNRPRNRARIKLCVVSGAANQRSSSIALDKENCASSWSSAQDMMPPSLCCLMYSTLAAMTLGSS